MPKLIQDQFTSLPISRQQKYQLRCIAAGKCRECGQPARGGCCVECQAIARERMREKRAKPVRAEDMI